MIDVIMEESGISPGTSGHKCVSSTLYTARTHCELEDQTSISTDEELDFSDVVWNEETAQVSFY